MNKRTSIIWKISNTELQKIFDDSSSYIEILKKLGFKSFSANRHTLKKRLDIEKLDCTKFNENYKKLRNGIIDKLKDKTPCFDEDDYLVENCKYSRSTVRRFILRNNILEYKCVKCGNDGNWLNEKISLQLEHKNGVPNDNRKDNLCFLCPNCHSQTSTWGGKKNKQNNTCEVCKNQSKGYSNICKKCDGIKSRKFEVSKEKLMELVNEKPIIEIGRIFNVSDNSIRKRCKLLDVEIPKHPPGYWIKSEKLKNTNKDQLSKDVNELTIKQLTKKYNCSVKLLKEICLKYEIKLRTISHTSPEEKRLIVDLKDKGFKSSEISKIVKRDRKVIYEIIKKYGGIGVKET